jgi:2-oxo-hept-3-ene-1,7-dioate hydratase
MKNFLILFCTILLLTFCKTPEQKTIEEPAIKVGPMDMLTNSILEARKNFKQTDLLSRELPNISRDQAFTIQLKMLEKELASGKKLIGYKMGGTAVPDSASFDPVFGYMLNSNVIEEDSTVMAKNFPGGDVMVEAEIGFKISKDFLNGVSSTEELKAGIEYVFGAVEFAKVIAIPIGDDTLTMNTNHIIASGTGQAGLIIGSGRAPIKEFDLDNETVSCLINGESKAEGISSNIYGNPLNALMAIANLLPKHGKFLKKGDVVITGSLYANPTINSTSDVLLKFSSLGEIHFSMK